MRREKDAKEEAVGEDKSVIKVKDVKDKDRESEAIRV